MQIVMAFMILTMVSVILPRAEVAAERVEEVITRPTSINDPASPKLPAASAPARGELTFRDVSFQYPDARADVISGVNFTTHAGQMLGIIGSTGSGKSTLVQLIPRLYDVTRRQHFARRRRRARHDPFRAAPPHRLYSAAGSPVLGYRREQPQVCRRHGE